MKLLFCTDSGVEMYLVRSPVVIAATLSLLNTRLPVKKEASITLAALYTAGGALHNLCEASAGCRAGVCTHLVVTVGRAFHG